MKLLTNDNLFSPQWKIKTRNRINYDGYRLPPRKMTLVQTHALRMYWKNFVLVGIRPCLIDQKFSIILLIIYQQGRYIKSDILTHIKTWIKISMWSTSPVSQKYGENFRNFRLLMNLVFRLMFVWSGWPVVKTYLPYFVFSNVRIPFAMGQKSFYFNAFKIPQYLIHSAIF